MRQFVGQRAGDRTVGSETKEIQQVRCSLYCLAALERRKICPFQGRSVRQNEMRQGGHSMSPAHRSVHDLKALGYAAKVVERWNPFAKVRLLCRTSMVSP